MFTSMIEEGNCYNQILRNNTSVISLVWSKAQIYKFLYILILEKKN